MSTPYTTRLLPPDEWHRIATELPDSPLSAPDVDLSKVYGHIVVLERLMDCLNCQGDGWILVGDPAHENAHCSTCNGSGRMPRIIGHWPLFLVWHAEPLYLAPEARTRGGVRALTNGLHQALAQFEIPVAFALIEDPATAEMAMRLGFQPSPAPVYCAVAPGIAFGRAAELLNAASPPAPPPLPQETP